MGHAKIGTTLGIYVHLFPDDDAADDMAALGAMARTARRNVAGTQRGPLRAVNGCAWFR